MRQQEFDTLAISKKLLYTKKLGELVVERIHEDKVFKLFVINGSFFCEIIFSQKCGEIIDIKTFIEGPRLELYYKSKINS